MEEVQFGHKQLPKVFENLTAEVRWALIKRIFSYTLLNCSTVRWALIKRTPCMCFWIFRLSYFSGPWWWTPDSDLWARVRFLPICDDFPCYIWSRDYWYTAPRYTSGDMAGLAIGMVFGGLLLAGVHLCYLNSPSSNKLRSCASSKLCHLTQWPSHWTV